MAKGHRSQIKRARNENKDTRPSAKLSSRKNVRTESMLCTGCNPRQGCKTALGILTYNPRYASQRNKETVRIRNRKCREQQYGMSADQPFTSLECYANKSTRR